MQKSLFKKGLVIGIIVLFIGASILLPSAISKPLPVHQGVYGYIEYSDGSWVPNGIPVNITDENNGNSMLRYTSTADSGHTGFYIIDVIDIDAEDGDKINVSVSYGGCIGNNSVFIDSSVPPQRCDITISGNLPPNIPGQPSGPTSGDIETSYNYSANTTDPDNDNIYYWFNWDDGNNSGWIGPYGSGLTVTTSHSWSSPGTYQVKVKAKDIYGAELGTLWSDPLNVTISSPNNPPNTPSNPNPYNGETEVDVDHDLSWTGGDPDTGDTVTYDVYFEKNDPTPDVLVSNNQSGTTYDPGTMDGHTQYYWKIVAWDNHGATATGPIWSFVTENNPPNTPSNPSPANHAAGVDINANLYWTGGDPDPGDTVTYDVYFGTSSSPPQVATGQSGTTYEPGTMSYSTIYYWKIVAWDNHGAYAEGPIWDFTTENNPPNTPSNPNPEDGATDVDINADLSWNCSDPDGDDLTYDVYFEADDSTPDVLVSDDQTETSFDPGTLDYETTYYWQIIAEDEFGAVTDGPIWSFTTEVEPPKIPDLDCSGTLSWTGVTPGSIVTGSFTVENIGDPDSLLDWQIDSYPDWGTWSFDPDGGDDLLAGDSIIVEVEVVAPDDPETDFTGHITIVNSEDGSDFCIIDVSLATPVNQQVINPLLQMILERFPNAFPIMRYLLGL